MTLAIASTLGIDPPEVRRGSTVPTEFLDRILRALGIDPSGLQNSYRKMERALAEVGETYDPAEDSSEARGRTGGGTITNAGYRKLLRGLSGEPRCFILSVADSPASSQYGDVMGSSYGFAVTVSGSRLLIAGGAGSRAIFYRTRNASDEPRRAFVGTAVVTTIERTGPDDFQAHLSGYRALPEPVLDKDVSIAGWNRQHGITEISHDTFVALERAGRGGGDESGPSHGERPATLGPGPESPATPPVASVVPVPGDETEDPLAGAGRIDGPVDLSVCADPLPSDLPLPSGPPSPDLHPALPVEGAGGRRGRRRPPVEQRRVDKFVEERAIFLATQYMTEWGWRLSRDCQALGVGYDLEFERDGTFRHVEVKGIAGNQVEFNLTALEWRRVLVDESFMVVAVTGALSPTTTRIRVLTRDQLQAAERSPVQYRLRLR